MLGEIKEFVGMRCPLNKTKDPKVFEKNIEVGINTRDKNMYLC